MARSFTDAIGYVERNENLWSEMIRICWQEWLDDHLDIIEPRTAQSRFKEYAQIKYGIKCWWNNDIRVWEFSVVDHSKYTFFQIKYARS